MSERADFGRWCQRVYSAVRDVKRRDPRHRGPAKIVMHPRFEGAIYDYVKDTPHQSAFSVPFAHGGDVLMFNCVVAFDPDVPDFKLELHP